MFLRGGKVNVVQLIKHCRKVKGAQVITLQMDQQLKTKNINVTGQGNYFVVSVKLNFCQRKNRYIDDQDKFQSVTDTDNEFTECQISRKKAQSIGILPVSLHIFMKTLNNNIPEAYKVQVDCLKNSVILMIKMI